MGDQSLMCPLCCNEVFHSKEKLIEHISSIGQNLFCPICQVQIPSLESLTDHLNMYNCTPVDSGHNIEFESENNNDETENSTPTVNKQSEEGNTDSQLASEPELTQIETEDTSDINIIQNDFMKCLQNQEVRVIKEDGENRYLIISEDSNIRADEFVTKQNKDGTISVTSVKDIKNEEVNIRLGEEKMDEDPVTLVQEYSCSTCQMSFTSVIDHINNYHEDQDVVLEANINNMSNIEFEELETEQTAGESTTSRRVITETGAIVETPVQDKVVEHNDIQVGTIKTVPFNQLSDNIDKPSRKKYVHVENFCEGVVRDLTPTQKGLQCHKVVVTSTLDSATGETVKMYNCSICKLFGRDLQHFRTHSCKPAKYSCTQCEMSYDNSKSLCAHMKVHKSKNDGTVDTPEVYVCEICCTVFLTNKSLKLHKRMHDPVKSRPIDPPKKSTSDDRYQCGICAKMIPLDYRAIHKASHENDQTLNCAVCNKKFNSVEYLEMHMNVHNVDKPQQGKSDKSLPYSCVYCNRKFARPHEKVKHERIHTGEKPHECEICGKSFRVSYCLTLHMRTHTGARPYACPHCEKRFKAHSVYNHHLLTHSEVRAYKCPYCPKAFKTSVQLAGHKNSHTKPFSCNQCNRPFASLYAVRAHTETHNRRNNLKFKCSLCGASYARAFALKDHVKQAHKQDVDTMNEQEDWSIRDGADVVVKDPTQEMTDLEIAADEMIVP